MIRWIGLLLIIYKIENSDTKISLPNCNELGRDICLQLKYINIRNNNFLKTLVNVIS